jgi:ketosteroid isomerase-like protein
VERADRLIPRDANEETVLAWYTSLMRRDLDAFEPLYAHDAVIDIIYSFPGLKPSLDGRQEIMDDYRRMFKNRHDHIFKIKSFIPSANDGCIVVESKGTSVVGETGKTYENDYVMIFHLENARIKRLRFYCNPQRAQEAFSGVLIGPGISVQPSN